MNYENIDPLIRREFESLGMNIVGNDLLADIVIEKVRKQRIRNFIRACAVVLALILIGLGSYILTTSKLLGTSKLVVQSNSYSDSGITLNGQRVALALPQFARIEVKENQESTRHVTFTFHLRLGQFLEVFTDPRNASVGDVGDLKVYPHGQSSPASRLGSYQIGGGTNSNEFGNIPADGLYDFVYDFTNLNYYGQVRIAFVLGKG
jgi:hypothetical protein